jgi:oxygen-independent coproporphyrinogen-3 oxidase
VVKDSTEYSIYLHIPFCRKKCPYCHFYVTANDEAAKDLLFNALLAEIGIWKKEFQDKKLVSIYFGGGTPSLFGADRVAAVLEALEVFEKNPQTEITLEANPEEISKARLCCCWYQPH